MTGQDYSITAIIGHEFISKDKISGYQTFSNDIKKGLESCTVM